MFDLILKRNGLPKPKYGVGLCIALCLHAAALFWIFWLPTRHPLPTHFEPEVILYKSLPQTTPSFLVPPPPPPLPQSQELQKNKPKPLVKPAAVPTTKPLEAEPHSMPADKSAPFHPLSEKYGVEGGNPDTNFDPALHGVPGPVGNPVAYGHGMEVLPFGEGMLPPKLLEEPLPIRFSREALAARVEGRAVVRCTINVEGNVENCRFIQKLPYMDEAILSALYRRKYSPASFQGKKISVDYNIPIRLKLP